MPAPGPGGAWIDDFVNPSNALSSKWVATRISIGGQNDGVLVRTIKDSKIYWKATSLGTEANYWGEKLSLPVNAPGDIIVEALIRHKTSVVNNNMGIGVNQGAAISWVRYGGSIFDLSFFIGLNNGGPTIFPGFPAMTGQNRNIADSGSILIKTVRRNGYMFIYIDGLYVGSYVYAATITTVDIVVCWLNSLIPENWIDYIKVTPREVVL